MADKDDTSKVPPDRNSDPTHVSAETSPAAGDRKVSNRPALTRLERAIEAQREQLLQQVWGWSFGDQSTLTVHVRRLREKIEDDPTRPVRLVTVFGVGYRWDSRPPDAA